MNLVKFSCGCVGFEPNVDGDAIIIQACDSDDGGLGLYSRSMKADCETCTNCGGLGYLDRNSKIITGMIDKGGEVCCRMCDGHGSRYPSSGTKSFEPLSKDATEELRRTLNLLVADGYCFRQVKQLLA